MGLKNKVFGTLAAAALTLSMVGSAAASDSVGGSVELAGTGCSVAITQVNITFGTWTWDGDSYELSSATGSNVSQLNASLDSGSPNGTCKIAINTAGLTSGGSTIAASNFGVTQHSSGQPNVNLPYTTPAFSSQSMAIYLMLEDVPDNFNPGTYTGDFVFTTSQVNP